ncbi:hypothetical protein BDB01DRAFT_720791 [Pilobolus umbonatus]|nr:hypothetical protein BDB01DRAFT_720791 [Pilobolus umbonatus]
MASITEVSDNLLLISFNKDIPPEEAGEYTTSLFATIHKNISRVIVLDSFSSIGYTSEVWGDELTPPFLRVLQTSTAVKIKGMTLYEVPNMIKGLSAAIINYCEIHSIACYDLLSLQESLYGRLLITEETLEAYIKGLRLFHIDMNFDRHTMKKVLEDKHQNTLTDDHHRLYL